MRVKRALVCAPSLPEFDRESGSRRTFDLVMFLRESGWAVSYCPENPNPPGADRYARILQQRGVATYKGFNDHLNQYIAAGQLDLVICAFWYIAELILPVVRALSPQTKIVVDSIDLHFLRNARRLLRRPEGDDSPARQLSADYVNDTARELNTYAAADAVFAVSQKETDLINDLLGDQSLAYTVTDYEDITPSTVPFGQRSGVLFVGNFRHPPNVEAIDYLCRQVIPRLDPAILNGHPVYVVGNAPNDAVRGYVADCPKDTKVRLVGWVPSVLPYLQRVRLTVVPLLHGAGTKRKLLQALMVGTPSVSTSIGTEGMDLRDGDHVLVANDPKVFADSVTRLLTNAELWHRLAQRGREHVAGFYGHEAVRERFMRVVMAVLAKKVKRMALSETQLRGYGPLVREQYRLLVDRIRAMAQAVLPANATVAVINKGDEELLKLGDVRAWHFPRADDGGYAGYYPADSSAAIRHLEDLRTKGVRYLLVPNTSFWWLTRYKEFGRHLRARYKELLYRDETCLIFDLQEARVQELTEEEAKEARPAGVP